jgi:hypothetical protein
MKKRYWFLIIFIVIIILLAIIPKGEKEYPIIDRYERIPADAIKQTPRDDSYPPILHSDEFEIPVPLAIISSAGAEDSPFIPYDRDEIYFVFVKDVREPVEIQVRDPANGIWMAKRDSGGGFSEPELVWLQEPDELALNGCEFVKGNKMIFCGAREGYTGLHWFEAEFIGGKWKFKGLIEFPEEYQIGELHKWEDELYYGSYASGGKGDQDVWMIKDLGNNEWSKPINIEAVNSEYNDGYPYLTEDGKELWINRFYQGSPSVWRSKKINGEWQEAELIVSQFAGEPTLDAGGNLYFVHHYYKDGEMIEADIYIAYNKN